MKMSQRQVERWERTRRMGRTKLIWLYGVLGWGVSVAVSWSMLMSWIRGWDRLHVLLPLALVIFPLGGFFFGIVAWRSSESRCAKTKDDPNKE
jgi:hypothetical protein